MGTEIRSILRRVAILTGLMCALAAVDAWPAWAGDPENESGQAFSLVVLPDTQYYAWKYPEIFHLQTKWIAENLEKYKIRYVLHLGDVVQHNSHREWKVAREAFARLDGKVPYAIAPGNHDLGPRGSAQSRDSLFGRYFPLSHFQTWPTFGGVYDREPDRPDNSCHLFEAAGTKWLILALEFGPRDDVVRWAREVVKKHPEHRVILITHAYLDMDGRRYDRTLEDQNYPPYTYPPAEAEGALNDGEQLWRKLLLPFPNTRIVLCGHVGIAARLASRGKAGNVVHQMLVNYQEEEKGGTGWLRLMEIRPGTGKIHVRDYSPLLESWSDHPDRNFLLSSPMF